MNPKKIDQIGCIDIGSNAIKYKQFRIIADDNQNYSKELETFARQMKKEGRVDLVEKIRAKKRHVDEHIEKYTDKAA